MLSKRVAVLNFIVLSYLQLCVKFYVVPKVTSHQAYNTWFVIGWLVLLCNCHKQFLLRFTGSQLIFAVIVCNNYIISLR